MCGRTACTLNPEELCAACATSLASISAGVSAKLLWREHPGDHPYTPSVNIAPSSFCPVLILEDNCASENSELSSNFVIQPMLWGLIPPFYKGEDPVKHGLKTNNSKLEGIEEKKTFRDSLLNGRRCIVLCEGFYEWQTTQGEKNKQPYFIHASQPEHIEIWNHNTWLKDDSKEEWCGPNLLKMAGLYSKWTSIKGEEYWSYSVITMEANDKFNWLHHRIPVILETGYDVYGWLNSKEISYSDALSKLHNDVVVSWYPVSKLVNNSRNQDSSCLKPFDSKSGQNSASSKLLKNWLASSSSSHSPSTKKADAKRPLKNDGERNTITKWLKK